MLCMQLYEFYLSECVCFVSYDDCKLYDHSDHLLHPQTVCETICMCLFVCKDTNLNIYVFDQKVFFIEDFPVSPVLYIY